jgi:hypothetical protein
LIGIRRDIDRLEAQFARRLHHFDRRRGFTSEGAVVGVVGAVAMQDVRRLRPAAGGDRAAPSGVAGDRGGVS